MAGLQRSDLDEVVADRSTAGLHTLVGLSAYATVIVAAVLALSQLFPEVGGAGSASELGAGAAATPYINVADPATPLGIAQRFVAAHAAGRQADARALLSPRLSAGLASLDDLRVPKDAGPGDEDGWPEPLNGKGNDTSFTLLVSFDSQGGEKAHGEGRGVPVNVMEFAFEKDARRWRIAGVKPVAYTPPVLEVMVPETASSPTPNR